MASVFSEPARLFTFDSDLDTSLVVLSAFFATLENALDESSLNSFTDSFKFSTALFALATSCTKSEVSPSILIVSTTAIIYESLGTHPKSWELRTCLWQYQSPLTPCANPLIARVQSNNLNNLSSYYVEEFECCFACG